MVVGITGDYPGAHLMAISTCPGDFLNLPENDNVYCKSSPPGATLNWAVGTTPPFACHLRENTTYYLNVAFVNEFSQQSTCAGESITSTNPTACRHFVEMR